MDIINKIMAIVWQIIESNHNCAVNIHTINNKLIVNIIDKSNHLIFSDNDELLVLKKLQDFLIA